MLLQQNVNNVNLQGFWRRSERHYTRTIILLFYFPFLQFTLLFSNMNTFHKRFIAFPNHTDELFQRSWFFNSNCCPVLATVAERNPQTATLLLKSRIISQILHVKSVSRLLKVVQPLFFHFSQLNLQHLEMFSPLPTLFLLSFPAAWYNSLLQEDGF